ncbi:MAG: efflux RND transporter permease subunit [Bacteroidetes bacterium]|nr:efflux RND transporter permease subunit [Bacteroidota bacterium]
MSAHIIDFVLKNRLFVLGFVVTIIGLGIYSLRDIPIDAFPDVTNNQVQVITEAANISPVEVERLVTFPIENAMNGIPDVMEVRSISKYGLSVVTVVFEDGVDTYFARQLISERLSNIRSELPAGVKQPVLGPVSTALGEIYQYVVEGEGYTPMELRTIQEWIVKPQLKTIPGVTEVNSFGGFVKQYQVLIDPGRLQTYDLTVEDVFIAVEQNNAVAGGSFLEKNGEAFIIRGMGLVTQPAELGDIVVKTVNNVPVFIRQVASVTVGPEVRAGAVTQDDKGEVVTGIIMMLKGENSREVILRIKEQVKEVNKSLPPGVSIRSFYDQTELVNNTIHTVQTNLIEGGILVIAVLFFFLGNWRAALIVALVIPLSMLFTFIGMDQLGLSANLMSLGALDFGMIVDGAVVLVDNFVRHMRDKRNEGKDRIRLIGDSAKEVARPITFGVIIIIMVYVPILTFEGMEGKMFAPMAYAVGFAILGSLILLFTYVPVVSTFFLKLGKNPKENIVIRWLAPRYRRSLRWSLQNTGKTVGAALLLLIGSLSLIPFMGSEFLPALDEGSFLIEIKRLPSVALSESVAQGSKIQKEIMRIPEVRTVVFKTGRPDLANDYMGLHETDAFVMLKARDEWRDGISKDDIEAELDAIVSQFPDISYGFTQPIAMRVDELVAGVKSDVAVKIFGEDFDVLRARSSDIERLVQNIPGTGSVMVEQVSGQTYLDIRIHRGKVARYGLNVADVQDVIETAIGGRVATEVYEGTRRVDVVVRYDQKSRDDIAAIRNLLVSLPDGSRLPLSQLADIDAVEGPVQISREQGQRRIVVGINLSGRDVGSYVDELQARVEENLALPAGYYLQYGGQFENQQRAMSRLYLVVPLALLIIYLLLFTMFGNLRNSLLILTNLPFALSGGILLLWLRGLNISVTSAIGFIALFGVAVLNGVVLIEHLNHKRKEASSLDDAVVEGSVDRLRPVLMTALVASLGFIPMALNTTQGSEVQRPLATVVIGGLITSTLLTLLVLPTIYTWIERRLHPELGPIECMKRIVLPRKLWDEDLRK